MLALPSVGGLCEESKREPFDEVSPPFAPVEAVPALASKAAPTKFDIVKPLAMSEVIPSNLTILAESSIATDSNEVKN